MTEPTNYDEYMKRFNDNIRYEGVGFDTKTITPCPFCAAPNFLTLPIAGDVRGAMEKGATCAECGRSAKALFTDSPDGGASFEVVQTGGPDQPTWDRFPALRRISVPADILWIMKHPGQYAVTTDLELNTYFMVEVEPDGTIHQLNPEGERDGVLSPEKWSPNVRVYVREELPSGYGWWFTRVPSITTAVRAEGSK